MADDFENHTLRLLQEMRSEMRDRFAGIEQRFTGVEQRLDGIEQRIDGNTLILNMLAGLIHDHEQRIEAVEAREG